MKNLKFPALFTAHLIMLFTVISVLQVQAQKVDDAYLLKSFDVSTPELDISTSGGFINVIGHNENRVRVEMYVRKGNKYLDQSDTELDDYEIDISLSGNKVTASAKRKSGSGMRFWNNNNNLSLSFVVYTPVESVVNGRTSGGSMSAENLAGTINFATSGGSITLEKITGNMDIKTSGGSLNFKEIRGDLSGKTSGGSITVNSAEGDLNLSTSGGSIALEQIAGSVSARTSGGSIKALTDDTGCSMDLRTSGGNVTISIPEGTGYELDLKGNRVTSTLKEFSGEVERNKLVGTIYGGGPLLAARTSGGTIRINYH
ncbi:MAG: DUF4097 domain-containing protein [Balneolaceae bacterium]